MEMRINKFLAHCGIASRREAEELIRDRRVTVNGEVVRELGTRVDPERDHVKVDGRLIIRPAAPVYLLYHKPKNMVCTMEDPEGRPCVGDFLRRIKGRPVPVGRLDFDAEGLLLCTNDGEMIDRLLHPRYHVRRGYQVKVKGVPDNETLRKLKEGIVLDGKKTGPAEARLLRESDKNAWISLALYEGRNQQIKRMLERVGHPVLKLKRVAFGPLKVTGIPIGGYRKLFAVEVRQLKALVESGA